MKKGGILSGNMKLGESVLDQRMVEGGKSEFCWFIFTLKSFKLHFMLNSHMDPLAYFAQFVLSLFQWCVVCHDWLCCSFWACKYEWWKSRRGGEKGVRGEGEENGRRKKRGGRANYLIVLPTQGRGPSIWNHLLKWLMFSLYKSLIGSHN